MSDAIRERARTLLDEQLQSSRAATDRMFAWLMVAQWVFAVGVAVVYSPYGWQGRNYAVHVHVWAALVVGGLLTAGPVILARSAPGAVATRSIVACCQMLWSALLIHLTGGRIETHFHVFGSLAFLAFYRDWVVLVPATVVVAGDHLLRQIFWPESVYGISNPEWWRFLEHAFWVVFEDIVLVLYCVRSVREVRTMCDQRAATEAVTALEAEKSAALDAAVKELERSQDARTKAERLAAIGQLAASVGHELRNPLAAVRNAAAYIQKRLEAKPPDDPRVLQFLGVIEREVGSCNRIIGDLLDFAREKPLELQPCALRPLVDEVLSIVQGRPGVAIAITVPEDLPIAEVDRDQLRQVLANLVQNAVEAMPAERAGHVWVRAKADGERLVLEVEDDGAGMPPEVSARIFEPLYTTKSKGTGLGLAIVANAIKRHRGTIEVSSRLGSGTRFVVTLPMRERKAA